MQNSKTIRQKEENYLKFLQIVTEFSVCWNVEGRKRQAQSRHTQLYFKVQIHANLGLIDGWNFCPRWWISCWFFGSYAICSPWVGSGKKKKKSNSAFPVCAWPRLNSLKSRSLGVNQTSHQAFGFWVLFGPITDPNMTQYSWACAVLSQKEVIQRYVPSELSHWTGTPLKVSLIELVSSKWVLHIVLFAWCVLHLYFSPIWQTRAAVHYTSFA